MLLEDCVPCWCHQGKRGFVLQEEGAREERGQIKALQGMREETSHHQRPHQEEVLLGQMQSQILEEA